MTETIQLMAETERAALVRLARSILGDAFDAEDAAQEALLRAYAARATRDPARSAMGWLRTITSNVARDVLRRRKRLRFVPLDAARLEPAAPDATADEARAARDARLLDALRAALAALPDAERAAFRLFYDEGKTVAAIARTLQAPEGTVKSWLHRARERLRERLATFDTEEGGR